MGSHNAKYGPSAPAVPGALRGSGGLHGPRIDQAYRAEHELSSLGAALDRHSRKK
jgi:hypothetical protein